MNVIAILSFTIGIGCFILGLWTLRQNSQTLDSSTKLPDFGLAGHPISEDPEFGGGILIIWSLIFLGIGVHQCLSLT